MKVITIIGARPQFIKAATVSRAFKKYYPETQEIIVHTGQHFDENMSDVFFLELSIPTPDYKLGIGGGTHGQNTGRMIEHIEEVLINEKPDWVLVYGDTDSTLAGALAASKLHIKIAHVESGLRSFNKRMPEEINRILTDQVSSILFTPSKLATDNLTYEGVSSEMIHQVGDVMFDASIFYNKTSDQESSILEQLDIVDSEYMLLTIHRRENTSSKVKLENIMHGLEESGRNIICPLHPGTKNQLEKFNIDIPKNIKIIQPVGYLDMISLQKNARLVITDSGGVQKEAYFYQVPCVILRDETEWVELVENGYSILTGSDSKCIKEAINSMTLTEIDGKYLYGQGDAAEKIVRIMADY
jgi:UDP-GlcNAc3NAcA epimerase